MSKKRGLKRGETYSLNPLYKAIACALPAFLGLSIVAHGATILNEGQDIYADGLNAGFYDLELNGNVTWNTTFPMNTAERANININGNGNTITLGLSYLERMLTVTQTTNNVAINNVTITSVPFAVGRYALILINQSNDTLNLDLEGTTFLDIGPTAYTTAGVGDYGPILSMRLGSGSVMNINGGQQGVLFKGNHGLYDQPGTIGLYGNHTINFTGKVSFEDNWTGNYGGALTVFEGTTLSTMTFGGEANFVNNHASVYGGAIDMWGGNSDVIFNGPAAFSGNYIFGTATSSYDYPLNVGYVPSRGGAINMGTLSPGAANSTSVEFNNTATFNNNYVIETKLNAGAVGGAISAYNVGGYTYYMDFNGATQFNGNYVYSLTGDGYGGAVYYNAGTNARINVGPGSSFTNNYAKTLGGAIYLETGTINLNADGGDIIFQGNRHGADFTFVRDDLYTPTIGSGTPNAIYMDGSDSLNLYTSADNYIHFYDPIASVARATISVSKTGNGEAIFHGNSANPGDPSYNSQITVNTNVNGGKFSLTDAVIYGVTSAGIFTVNNSGTVQGNNSSTLQANSIVINAGGGVAVNGGIFNLAAGAGGVTSNAGSFSGFGTISAPEISLSATASNISTANVSLNDVLTINGLLSGAGGLNKIGDGVVILNRTNTYTGATGINGGTLRANIGNIIAASSGLTITSGTFDLNGYSQTVNNLAGTGGAITTSGNSTLTVNSTANTSYAGAISGVGALVKQGSGSLTLTGGVNLAQITTLAGNLIANGANIQTEQTIIGRGGAGSSAILNSASTSWQNTGASLIVGDNSLGGLAVSGGAQLSNAGTTYIGYQSGGIGVVSIADAGTFADLNNLRIGYDTGSIGTLDLDDGAVLQVVDVINGSGNGRFSFNNGTLRAKTDSANFIAGFSSGELLLDVGGGIIDSNGFTIATDNVFIGTGPLSKAGAGTLTLTGVNGYSGRTNVTGGVLRLTGAGTIGSGAADIASGATLFIDSPTGGDYAFNNELYGAGLLQAGLSATTDRFSFGTGVGAAFTGTARLGNGLFDLSGNNTAVLTNAVLQLDSGNTTTVGAGAQTIGGFTLNGGALRFENLTGGIINTGLLTLNSGSVAIDPSPIATMSGNVLTQDEGVDFQLISATGVNGDTSGLTLTDLSGSAPADTGNIVQGGNIVAVGSYNFELISNATGLFARHLLNRLDLQAGQTLTLSGDATVPTGADELHAQLTGSGNLNVNATTGITLNNGSNSYTGSTTVAGGTLITGVSGTLGNTSNLIVNGGAAADLNGTTQTVGALNGAGGLAINAGNLSVSNGGAFGGAINGATGALNLLGGTLTLTGTNTYTGATTVNGGAGLQIGSGGTGGSYAGNITNNGTVTFNRSDALTYAGIIDGAGNLIKTGAGTLTLRGVNAYGGGTSINAGTVIATQGQAFGSGAITNNAALQLDFATDSVLSNQLIGSGSLTKTGAGNATLNANGSAQGAISVNQGTLSFAQSGAFNGVSLTTATGATTSLAEGATLTLTGALTQNANSTLEVLLDGTLPVVNALSASLSGVLKISGVDASAIPTSASALSTVGTTIISTTDGISGDFTSIDFNGVSSPVDYLTLGGRINNGGNDYSIGYGLTWLAGTTNGNGVFTLTNPTDTFNVDVALNNQSPSITTGWDGASLTKQGAGTLILSAANGYSGNTNVNAGTLRTDIANAFANSTNVIINSGASLDLNGFTQQANNLQGGGNVTLGNAVLNANNTADSAFSGVISGVGSLSKTGAGALTLSGVNSYSGGTTINAGTLVATQGQALGGGAITNNAALRLDFATDSTLANQLTGSGSLTKIGAGIATLNASGSSQGTINVNQGTLSFAQTGAFNGTSLTTATNAATSLAADSTLALSGTLTQQADSTLNVIIGSTQPVITAVNAVLNGNLNITDFNVSAPNSASALTNTQFTVIRTTGGISGDFTNVDLGGAASSVDYLRLAGGLANDNRDYNVGFGLTWLAGATFGNGTFTLTNPTDIFDVDMALNNQNASATGWNGASLTKEGAGTLILSATNGYTGDTNVNAGTLRINAANALTNSANVIVNGGATLDLNGVGQQVNQLQGAGNVALGNATINANNSGNSAFSGVISGAGGLTKTGAGMLTLSGVNTYAGGTTIGAGTLVATQGQALGGGLITNDATLQLDFGPEQARAVNNILQNQLTGTGALVKTGLGTATLTGVGSSQGAISVNQGTLNFAQTGAFNGISLTTASGAATSLAADSTLALSGTLTQQADSTLNVIIGSTQPVITAVNAVLSGNLNIAGFTASAPNSASALTGSQFTVIRTTDGISGDFANINLGGAASDVDYLRLAGGLANGGNDYNIGFGLTWLAGATFGNGVFTLTNPTDTFDVDIALGNQGPSTTGWDGASLTKEGAGTLILSAANTYTGNTNVNAGTLRTDIANTFANSANVIVNSGATLDLNNFAQQVNNLQGSGTIALGNATLNANNTANSLFSGVISGAGGLTKTGAGALTLSGVNSYSSGTTINAGTLVATQGQALGGGAITNNAALQLDFAADSTLANQLIGPGSLTKTGAGIATLNASSSSQGTINVNQGTLSFAQTGAFNGTSLTTATNAATSLAADSTLTLTGALTQQADSTLNVIIGSTQPVITAVNAVLSGNLNITGFTSSAPNNASALTNTQFNVISTTGGISGDFANVNLGGAASDVDYLRLAGGLANGGNDYNIGFSLTWLAGAANGNGTFTLTNPTDNFNVDMALTNQGPSTTGWDGTSLTKQGAGTLILSANNTYSGNTNVNAGTLRTDIANTFANSANVIVNNGATLDLNNFAQQVNNLQGSGTIALGNATLNANNTADSLFSGVISGAGGLIKTGAGALTLSGVNTYAGGTAINAGTLIATQGLALGGGAINNNAALQLDFAADSELNNQLIGGGSLTKTGAGNAVLTGANSTQGAINVSQGALSFAQTGAFNGASLTTASGAITRLSSDSGLNLSGTLTQTAGSVLEVALGSLSPIISANSAAISGELRVSGLDVGASPTRAGDLPNTLFTIIRTVDGISGDFTNIDLGGAQSGADYLTLISGKSGNDYNVGFGLTWQAGPTLGDGLFTLAAPTDTFEVDIVLDDESASATGWDGRSLTKEGAGTLILSAANTYSGDTLINRGTLQTNVDNAFANSASVNVNNNALLDLNGYAQTANNLTGVGGILLGNGDLTVNSVNATSFSGSIVGTGGLTKVGAEAFTLAGINNYTGATTINQGRLIGTQGHAFGTGIIDNYAELELAFGEDSTLKNRLSGNGALIKTGAGRATLTAADSVQGDVRVNQGALYYKSGGNFSADSYETAAGATTSLSADSTLTVNNQFNNEGRLDVMAGHTQPVVTADTMSLGSASTFNLSGYSAPEATSAGQLAYGRFNIIQTSAPGNLTGNFSDINLGGATSPVDYLTMAAFNDGQNFDVGLELTWYAAHSSAPQRANGVFTLSDSGEFFDLDVVLSDQTANAATGWDGRSLTKAGDGTLQLSKTNAYTGDTFINGGTLRAGNRDVIVNSPRLTIAQGAMFDLNDFDQRVNNLNGDGDIWLGGATLTSNHETDSVFGGIVEGTGGLVKSGPGMLTLTNDNTFNGFATISSGTLRIGDGGDKGSVKVDITNNGTLIFDRGNDHRYRWVISGSGNLIKQGSGILLFSQNQTYTGPTDVNVGALIMMDDAFIAGSGQVNVAQGAILGGYGGVNGSVINNGLLAVADAAPCFENSPAGNFTVGGNFTNNGEIRMASPLPNSRLIVQGDYIGNNGLLMLSTQLGDDNSYTDKLVVQGDTSGSTRVAVNNSNGAGAATNNGIEIVSVGGQSNGQFTLANRVVAGAYEYNLYQGLPNQSNGNWYLRSQSPDGPEAKQWRPEIGGYLGNQYLTELMQSNTLFDRQGSQFRNDNSGAWGRIISGRVDGKAAGSRVNMDSDYTVIQLGGDLFNATYNNQNFILGVMGSFGDGETDAKGNRDLNGVRHKATASVDGYSIGAYATWFADAQEQKGLYVDSWFQYGWFDNDVRGEGMRNESYDSRAWSGSVETGYTFVLNDDKTAQWSFIPQTQIIYNDYSADALTDSSGTVIDGQKNDAWTTRVGGRLTGRIQNEQSLFHPYAEVNWLYSSQKASVRLNGERVEHDKPKNRAEFKVGLQSEFDNRLSTSVHLNAQTGSNSYRDIGGGVNVRYTW